VFFLVTVEGFKGAGGYYTSEIPEYGFDQVSLSSCCWGL